MTPKEKRGIYAGGWKGRGDVCLLVGGGKDGWEANSHSNINHHISSHHITITETKRQPERGNRDCSMKSDDC